MKWLLLPLSIPIMVGLAVAARGDPNSDDAAFLASLSRAGITYRSADQAVTAAKSVCDLISSGNSGPEVVRQLTDANPAFATDAATKFTGIAVNAYCPDQLTPGSDGSAKSP